MITQSIVLLAKVEHCQCSVEICLSTDVLHHFINHYSQIKRYWDLLMRIYQITSFTRERVGHVEAVEAEERVECTFHAH